VTLVLYLPGFWWGAPYATAPDRTKAWAVDDETPLGPLAEINNIIRPRPDRNLGYPLLYSFMVAACDAPYLGVLAATGGLRSPSPEYPFGLTDPLKALRVLTWIPHLLTVGLGVITVLAAFETARISWDERTALVAAAFAGCCYPMWYYARTGNVDVPMLCFTALAVAAYALIVSEGMSVRGMAWLGVFAGAALATKEEAAGALVPIMGALLLLPPRPEGTQPVPSAKPLAVGLLAGLVSLAVLGGFAVDPHRYIQHLQFITGRVQAAPDAQELIPFSYPFTVAGNLEYLRSLGSYLIDILTLPGLILSLGGLVWTTRTDRNARYLAILPAGYLAFIFVVLRSGQLRYVLPAGFLLALFAGRAAVLGWSAPQRVVRLGTAALALCAVGLNVLRGIDLTNAMLHDSRWDAAAWLAPRTQPGDHVAYFGATQKLPPLKSGVVSDRSTDYHGLFYRHRVDQAKIQEILAHWRDQPPRFVIIMPDHSGRPGLPYDASVPPGLYTGLLQGSLGWTLLATFETPSILPWVHRPALDYPMLNPPIRIFTPVPMSEPVPAVP
jgi:hypothetical protein